MTRLDPREAVVISGVPWRCGDDGRWHAGLGGCTALAVPPTSPGTRWLGQVEHTEGAVIWVSGDTFAVDEVQALALPTAILLGTVAMLETPSDGFGVVEGVHLDWRAGQRAVGDS